MNTHQEFIKWAATKKSIKPIQEKDGLKIGDTVTFTNENGVRFHGHKIIGIDADESFYKRCFYLNIDAYWFPIKAAELTKEN